MSRLPAIDHRRMDRALRALGFVVVRQRGSHAFYRHEDGRVTTIPVHAGRDLARPLVRDILRDIELTPDEFAVLLNDL